jgi:hypothetical protein
VQQAAVPIGKKKPPANLAVKGIAFALNFIKQGNQQ